MRKSVDKVCPYIVKTYRYLISVEVEEDQIRKSILEFQMWFIVIVLLIQFCSKEKIIKSKNKFIEELSFLARRMNNRCQAIKSSQSIQIMFNLIYGYQ
jgi:hypothetical protein